MSQKCLIYKYSKDQLKVIGGPIIGLAVAFCVSMLRAELHKSNNVFVAVWLHHIDCAVIK